MAHNIGALVILFMATAGFSKEKPNVLFIAVDDIALSPTSSGVTQTALPDLQLELVLHFFQRLG